MKRLICLIFLFLAACIITEPASVVVVQAFNDDTSRGVVAYKIEGPLTYKHRNEAMNLIQSYCGNRGVVVLNEERKTEYFFRYFHQSVSGDYMVIIYRCQE